MKVFELIAALQQRCRPDDTVGIQVDDNAVIAHFSVIHYHDMPCTFIVASTESPVAIATELPVKQGVWPR
jgi:hypothetical protein